MNKVLDKILLLLPKTRLYLGCFRGDSNKTLQRHCEIWKFRMVVFY